MLRFGTQAPQVSGSWGCTQCYGMFEKSFFGCGSLGFGTITQRYLFMTITKTRGKRSLAINITKQKLFSRAKLMRVKFCDPIIPTPYGYPILPCFTSLNSHKISRYLTQRCEGWGGLSVRIPHIQTHRSQVTCGGFWIIYLNIISFPRDMFYNNIIRDGPWPNPTQA